MIRKRIVEVVTTSQALSSAVLNFTTSLGKDFRLLAVIFHMGTGITETLTVDKNAKAGSDYDGELLAASLTTADDYVFRPTGECVFVKGDEVTVKCTKSTATTTIYVSIYIEEI